MAIFKKGNVSAQNVLNENVGAKQQDNIKTQSNPPIHLPQVPNPFIQQKQSETDKQNRTGQ